MSSRIWIRRAYEPPTRNDGQRVLVDRLWPRGVSRDDADIDEWLRDVSPSDELRQWFGHDPQRWDEFQRRYRAELKSKSEPLESLLERVRHGRVTLVFAAHDEKHNNAVALRKVIEERLDTDA